MNRPRIGLLVPFVPFYETIVALRPEKERFANQVRERLADFADVLSPGLVCSEEESRAAAEEFRRQAIDAVVVTPSIAVFGALPWAALEPLSVPVCIWNLQPASRIPVGYNIQELIRNSGGLGVQALANTLARAGRFFEVVFSAENDELPPKLIRFLRAARVVGGLGRARFGQIGTVFPQMTDVQFDLKAWPGEPIVVMEPREFTQAYRDQPEPAVIERTAALRKFPLADIGDGELSRSARLSLALDSAVETLKLDGGAFNCHGSDCLQNPEIGVTACYAVSRQTSLGRPFSCTGDLPTAIALWIMRQVSGIAIYGELDLVDREAGIVLLANGGEGDFEAAVGPVTIAGNENFAGVHGRGASLRFRPWEGPTTLLSFTPVNASGRYRLVIGDGEILPLQLEGLGVFHAGFRFTELQAGAGFERWCEAGAVHHAAIGRGCWSGELIRIAAMAGWEAIVVGGRHAS